MCARVAPRSKALINYRLIIAFALFFFSRNTPELNDEDVAHGPKVLQMGEKVAEFLVHFCKFLSRVGFRIENVNLILSDGVSLSASCSGVSLLTASKYRETTGLSIAKRLDSVFRARDCSNSWRA